MKCDICGVPITMKNLGYIKRPGKGENGRLIVECKKCHRPKTDGGRRYKVDSNWRWSNVRK